MLALSARRNRCLGAREPAAPSAPDAPLSPSVIQVTHKAVGSKINSVDASAGLLYSLRTFDQTLSLTADQRTKITPAYTALNGVMKDAAAKRQAFRQQMQASGFQFGQEPTPEMRAKMDTARTEMEGLQAEADQWYAAIRNNLTPAQQTKLDALPKPQVRRDLWQQAVCQPSAADTELVQIPRALVEHLTETLCFAA